MQTTATLPFYLINPKGVSSWNNYLIFYIYIYVCVFMHIVFLISCSVASLTWERANGFLVVPSILYLLTIPCCLNPKYSAMDRNGPTHWKPLMNFCCFAQSSGLRQSGTRQGKLFRILNLGERSAKQTLLSASTDWSFNIQNSETMPHLLYSTTNKKKALWLPRAEHSQGDSNFLSLKRSCKVLANPVINSWQKKLFLFLPWNFVFNS